MNLDEIDSYLDLAIVIRKKINYLEQHNSGPLSLYWAPGVQGMGKDL